MAGILIATEGEDGAGKTTFVDWLKEKHPEYVYSREPGGAPASEEIRRLLLSDEGRVIDPATRMHLFWASRAENLNKVIIPALHAGKVVVTDRFDASTYAYQIGGDRRTDLEPLFWQMRDFHLGHGEFPIRYLFFSVPIQVSEERLAKKGGGLNHFDTQGREYREEVSRHYWSFFGRPKVREVTQILMADRPLETMLEDAYTLFQLAVK
jgi:dTMP kinase